MKKIKCCHCQTPKPSGDFAKSVRRRKYGLICKLCKSEYNANWYQRNKRKHKTDVMRNNKRYRDAGRLVVDPLKAGPCKDCGNSYPPVAMDFDHVRGKKVMGVSNMVSNGLSAASILKEIAKCDLVCAVCHRIRTEARK